MHVLALLVPVVMAAPGPNPQPPEHQGLWRKQQNCGLNCLYLLLHAHSRPVEYQELEEAVPVTERGSSLVELRAGASRFGLATTVFRASPADLARLPLPLIAHLETDRASGHYVLLMAVEEGRVHILDGATALDQRWAEEDFRRRFSGYVLVVAAPGHAWVPWAVSVGVALLGVAGLWWWRGRRGTVGSTAGPAESFAIRPEPEPCGAQGARSLPPGE